MKYPNELADIMADAAFGASILAAVDRMWWAVAILYFVSRVWRRLALS